MAFPRDMVQFETPDLTHPWKLYCSNLLSNQCLLNYTGDMIPYHGIGIDIGAANSCVAITQNGNTLTLENEHGARQSPTCVAFVDGLRFIGTSAKLQQESNITNTYENFTSLLGKTANDETVAAEQEYLPYSIGETADGRLCIPVSFAGREWRFVPEQLVAMVLKNLMSIVESSVTSKTQAVVIGVPDFYDESEQKAMLDAARIAKLSNVTLLDATTAIGIFYAHGPNLLPDEGMPPKKVAFINIGHKSTQVSICAFTKSKMKILGSASDPQLGGRDFDRVLNTRLQQQFANTWKSGKATPVILYRLRKEAELLKIRMTSSAAEISVLLERLLYGNDLKFRISRAQFEGLLSDLLNRFRGLFEECIRRSTINVKELSAVELIGGGFRVHAIQQMVHFVFRQMGHPIVNGDEAVARGCALYAGMISPGVGTHGLEAIQSPHIKRSSKDCNPGYSEGEFCGFWRTEDELTELDTYERTRQDVENSKESYWFEANAHVVNGAQEGDVTTEEHSNLPRRQPCFDSEKRAVVGEHEERLRPFGGMIQVNEHRGEPAQRFFRPLSLFAGSVATLTDTAVPKAHFSSSTNLSRPYERSTTKCSATERTPQPIIPIVPRPVPDSVLKNPPAGFPKKESLAPPAYRPTCRPTIRLGRRSTSPKDDFEDPGKLITSKSLSSLRRADNPVLYRTNQVYPTRAERTRSQGFLSTVPPPLPLYRKPDEQKVSVLHDVQQFQSTARPTYQKPDEGENRQPEANQTNRPIQLSRASSAYDLSLGASVPELIPSKKALEEYILSLEHSLQARGRYLVDREEWLNLCRSLDETKHWFKNDEKRKTPDDYEQRLSALKSMGDVMERRMEVATEAIKRYEETLQHIRDIIDGEVFRGKSLSSVQLEKLRQLVSDHEEWFSSVLDPSESVVGTGSNGHTLDYFNAKHRGLMEAYEDILRSPTRTEHSPPPHSDTRQEMTMSIPVVAGTVSSSAGHRPVAYPTGSLLIRDNEIFTNDYNHNRTVPSETSILEGDLNQLDHQHHTPSDVPGSTSSTLNPGSPFSSHTVSPTSEFFSTPDESFHQAIRSSQRSTSSRNEFSTGTRTITIIRARQGEESTTYTQTTQPNSIPRSLESQQVTPSELYDQVAFYERVIAERTYELFNIKYEVYASEAFDTSKLNSRLLRVHEEIKRFNETSQYTANLRHILMDAESDRRKYNRYRVDEVTDAIASVKNRLKSAVNVLNKHIAECRSWLKEKASTVSNGYEQVYRASREDLGEYQETINREYEILGDNFNVFLSMVRDSDQRSEAYPSERHRRPNTLPRVVLRESSNINQPMKVSFVSAVRQ
ncbi:97 kDa heat shock protein, variant 2 [Clonorchis sinensis]|uniref:97 kDa heat shock protein, variant 2 n=1 Tax=Clonorchis sinensis TaxID=79923 RepID=A0A8T1MCU4_CLOSI|nr:97 kDa heat shock protein, variant 2 [Clonorchis sinensis]